MGRIGLTQNRGYEERLESALMTVLAGADLNEVDPEDGDQAEIVETFREYGLVGNRGLVLQMASGAEVRLTIQAFTRVEA